MGYLNNPVAPIVSSNRMGMGGLGGITVLAQRPVIGLIGFNFLALFIENLKPIGLIVFICSGVILDFAQRLVSSTTAVVAPNHLKVKRLSSLGSFTANRLAPHGIRRVAHPLGIQSQLVFVFLGGRSQRVSGRCLRNDSGILVVFDLRRGSAIANRARQARYACCAKGALTRHPNAPLNGLGPNRVKLSGSAKKRVVSRLQKHAGWSKKIRIVVIGPGVS